MRFRHLLLAPLAGLILAAAPTATAQAPLPAEAVVSAADRLIVDKARDLSRKPVEVATFAGVKPGMRILDLYSGGGYFAELFARMVGAQGAVVAHNNPAYLQFAKDELVLRDYPHRLPNVRVMIAENNKLQLAEASYDLIFFSLGYHDLALDKPEEGWPKIDAAALRRMMFAALKPGGTLLIIDHRANPGVDAMTPGAELHRVDPAVVTSELQDAGFRLVATSDLLANPADDHLHSVFDRAIRGQTDRFILKFSKPAA